MAKPGLRLPLGSPLLAVRTSPSARERIRFNFRRAEAKHGH